jgi:uncharacterized protein YkwD
VADPWQHDEIHDPGGYFPPDGHQTEKYGQTNGYGQTDRYAQTDGRSDPWSGDRTPIPTGRHRDPRRCSIPVGLAGVVAVLLLLLGVGAALLPANFSGDASAGGTAPAGDADALVRPAGRGGGQDLLSEEPGDAPSPTPGAATPSPTPSARKFAKPSPPKARRAAPAPATPTRDRTPAAPAAPAGDSREEQVLSLVNQERAAAGCGALRVNDALTTAARSHSRDQAETNTMSHTGSDGSSPSERARRAGYNGSGVGENVAFGYATPAAVMEGWMNSPGHRQNILNCGYRVIGIGVAAADNGRLYWTQMFGTAG